MLNFLWWFVVGPIVGWVTGRVMRAQGGWWLDVIAGLIGAFVMGTACTLLDLDFVNSPEGSALVGGVGALIVVLVFRWSTRNKNAMALPRSGSRSYTSYKSRMRK